MGYSSAAISGFLGSSRCFVATAAFRSPDAGPVRLFREFRDMVLLEFLPGRAFVEWYYSWSPDAAAWLESHDWLRGRVLHGFIPIEIGSWLVLNPPAALLVMLLFGAVLMTLRRVED
jgi:hypothetical protein